MSCSLASPAQTSTTREHMVKAVFLFNFTQFVEWPPTAYLTPQQPFVIGIFGKNPFGSSLNEIIVNESVNGHPIEVKQYDDPGDIKDCHILFINTSDLKKSEQIISGIKGQSVLTVGDSENFIESGGMLRLYRKNDKIQIQVNPEVAKEAGLIISSKLLRLSEISSPKNK